MLEMRTYAVDEYVCSCGNVVYVYIYGVYVCAEGIEYYGRQ